jgi:hypothetical protein
VRQAPTELCTDSEVIAYRHEVAEELLHDVPPRERGASSALAGDGTAEVNVDGGA